MTDRPIARERQIWYHPLPDDEAILGYKAVEVWCQGCEMLHHFTYWVDPGYPKRTDGSDQPVWTWNGSLTSPSFEPSLLCYSTVHLCEGEHDPVTICDQDFATCGHHGHGYVWVNDETGVQGFFKVYEEPTEGWTKHTFGGGIGAHKRDPAYGNCHSFLRNGVWEFLGDCAHALRGAHPLQPLPEWLFRFDDESDD